ncbi:MAG: dihydroorotase [Cyanobacteriota bacterium]|nr:dihydroorotase [Cyanobacteriota bacterium]
MASIQLLRQVHVLEGPDQPPARRDVWLEGRRLLGWDLPSPPLPTHGTEVLEWDGSGWWLAPPLVDPHSVLEDPWLGRSETLASLAHAAATGGYGTVALLPWARPWRDAPERLTLAWKKPLRLALWGSFSVAGGDAELALHAEQLAAGALGVAGSDHLPPLALLERGLRLGEMGEQPVLLAPRDPSLAQEGFVRERVEALRAGWPTDPALSETLPLQTLLNLRAAYPGFRLRLMNLSTAEAVSLLRQQPDPPVASVSWWHLLADSGGLHPADEGWRVQPSLGGPGDREALIQGLLDGVLSAVAVHHLPLDAEEQLLPLDQRKAGVAGHGIALSMLWRELVERRGWPVEALWQALSWGPSRFLTLPPERLTAASERWLLWDPSHAWWPALGVTGSLAANRPSLPAEGLRGRVIASGLLPEDRWSLAERPRC